MAQNDSTGFPSMLTDRTAANRGVADDMAAIFGPERRATAAPPAAGSPPRRSRLAVAALVAGGLTAVVGAGLMAGGSVVGLPASASVETRAPSLRRAAVAPPTFEVAGPQIPVSAPVPTPEGPPPTPFLSAPRAEVTVRPVAPVAPTVVPARPQIERTIAAEPRQVDCEDDGTCADGRLEAAERDIADAYAEASNAGVRARVLRGYRNEWLRARDEAAGRPREALRLYAMMTADLQNLTEDAVAAGRPDWR